VIGPIAHGASRFPAFFGGQVSNLTSEKHFLCLLTIVCPDPAKLYSVELSPSTILLLFSLAAKHVLSAIFGGTTFASLLVALCAFCYRERNT
jgi:hypothetical protein